MNNKNIIFVLYIVCFLQIIYSYNQNETELFTYNDITTSDKHKLGAFVYTYKSSISKEIVLKITDEFYHSYYCKNDICVSIDNYYNRPFIEIPDENGIIDIYISETYTHEYVKFKNPPDKKCYDNRCVSIKCHNDSECLYNKCIDNFCIFNEEAPVVHCDNVYLGHRKSYTHCGKAFRDTCNNNDECSSNYCYNSTCSMQTDGPSDSEGVEEAIMASYLFLVLMLIVLISICCCCHRYRKKHLKEGEYLFKL